MAPALLCVGTALLLSFTLCAPILTALLLSFTLCEPILKPWMQEDKCTVTTVNGRPQDIMLVFPIVSPFFTSIPFGNSSSKNLPQDHSSWGLYIALALIFTFSMSKKLSQLGYVQIVFSNLQCCYDISKQIRVKSLTFVNMQATELLLLLFHGYFT